MGDKSLESIRTSSAVDRDAPKIQAVPPRCQDKNSQKMWQCSCGLFPWTNQISKCKEHSYGLFHVVRQERQFLQG